MLQDGISLLDSSVIENFQIQNGTSLPSTGLNLGELFYLTSGDVGLYIYNGAEWVKSTGSGAVYTAGSGIAISGSNVISSTVSAAGNAYQVQMSDGSGGFAAIPAPSAENLVLTSHVGATPTWEIPQVSGGTVTSVAVSGGTTGLTTSGGPIITDGEIVLNGTLNIAHGGTGATTVAGVISNILPDQTNHSGAALVTDGNGTLSWAIQPGTTYSVGTGLAFDAADPTKINSLVADNTGAIS